MDIPLADYLDAKYALDRRSLNPEVRCACAQALGSRESIEILDLGAGTGASLPRLLELYRGSFHMHLLDRDAALLRSARQRAALTLGERGFRVADAGEGCTAVREGRTIRLRYIVADLPDAALEAGRFDLILAHAVLDLLPLDAIAVRCARWLHPGGLLWATLHYDGLTCLLPPFPDEGFEKRLLDAYNASMESRRVAGLPTGGAHCGRRLHSALARAGLGVLAAGASPWNLTPLHGRYREGDAVVLEAMLQWITGEGRAAGLAGRLLDAWLARRRAELATGTLAMVVHHLDSLAGRRPTRP